MLSIQICQRQAIKHLTERWKLSWRKNKSCAEIAKIYDKNESYVFEIMKKQKIKFMLVFPLHLRLATMCDKCLVKTEKVLNLYKKIFWESVRPHSHDIY